MTWIALVLNLTVAALLGLLCFGDLPLRRRRGKHPRVKLRLAVGVAAIAVVLVLLNLDYRRDETDLPETQDIRAPGKADARARLLAEANKMVGMAMLDAHHPDGVLCCDVAFTPMNAACDIGERMVADYHALDDPTVRYPLCYDVRRCAIRRNLKCLFDRVTGATPNTPDNPYFLRRINNLTAYLKSRGLYYDTDAIEPKPGMLLFFQRPRDDAPTHVAVLSGRTDAGLTVIQTSGSFDGNDDGTPDLKVVEVPLSYITHRTRLVGYGDVPATPQPDR